MQLRPGLTHGMAAGSIRWQGWGWKPLSLQGLALVQPDRIGGHTILEIARVETKAPASALLTGTGPCVHSK